MFYALEHISKSSIYTHTHTHTHTHMLKGCRKVDGKNFDKVKIVDL